MNIQRAAWRKVHEEISAACRADIQKATEEIKQLGSKSWLAVKRSPISGWSELLGGPKRELTLFEALNRLGSNVVLVNAVPIVFGTLDIDTIEVQFGNENDRKYDLVGYSNGNLTLACEAFNVANSFFQGKRNSSLQTLLDLPENVTRCLIFNGDAAPQAQETSRYQRSKGERGSFPYRQIKVNGERIE